MKSQVSHTGRQAKPGNRKVLVVANKIIEGQTLRQAIGLQVGDEAARRSARDRAPEARLQRPGAFGPCAGDVDPPRG